MKPNVYERLEQKLRGLFGELAGERAERLDGAWIAKGAEKAIESSLKIEFGAKRAWEIAFHLSDWGFDAAFIVAMHLFPERFRADEIAAGVTNFLIHAPNHIASAAHWHGDPIRDNFKVGLKPENKEELKSMPAGYSGTPLAQKLGYKPGVRVHLDNAPDDYAQLLSPLPEGVQFLAKLANDLDLVHLFTDRAKDLASKLKRYLKKIKPAGSIWVSWPKKASKRPTDITEDVIRETALAIGLVDVKVCAVDDVWSALKLVIRVANR
jgi:Protein of unknown function (DUF3052)